MKSSLLLIGAFYIWDVQVASRVPITSLCVGYILPSCAQLVLPSFLAPVVVGGAGVECKYLISDFWS